MSQGRRWGPSRALVLAAIAVVALLATVGTSSVAPLHGNSPASRSGRVPPEMATGRRDTSPSTAIQFYATGLRSGSTWWVALGAKNESGTGSPLVFFEPKGNYSFRVGSVGYTASPSAGTVNVSTAYEENVSVAFQIIWAGPYTVTFLESGLANGTVWSVTLNGITNWSSRPTVGIGGLSPGTYAFRVQLAGNLTPMPEVGNVTVRSVNVTVGISFLAPPAPVPHVGPFQLTWAWGFAFFALALWVSWFGYRLVSGLSSYLRTEGSSPAPGRRRVLNKLRIATHVGVLGLEGVLLVVLVLAPPLFSLGPVLYGITLLVVLGVLVVRSNGAFAPTLGEDYWSWEPAAPSPCWRCGRLSPPDAATCTSCGASLQG